MRYICLVVFTALAGCMSPEEVRNQSTANCTSYGFRPGTAQFAQCMQAEAIRADEQKQRRVEALRSLSHQPSSSTTCRRFGNTVRCTSY